eukprot:TRINITY_DN24072_c0_g1_i1.p1 TRINITY_DN24072_c0_g1~~TRINITY_DN24072_c0_g1_i1.p1  ORF type:complete len:652 (-),score=68.15 TRINITY_DN24072_c0_g1_i1:346-2301(-)
MPDNACLLPFLHPPDISSGAIGEACRLTAQELEEIAPEDCGACHASLACHTEGSASTFPPKNASVRVPVARAGLVSSAQLRHPPPSKKRRCAPHVEKEHAILNAGCFVSSTAWAPAGAVDGHVLAVGVHGRRQPVTILGSRVTGLASIQLWLFHNRDPTESANVGNAASPQTPELRLGIVHNGGSAYVLQWLPSAATPSRLGVLLCVLGDGSLVLYSVPLEHFSKKPFRDGSCASLSCSDSNHTASRCFLRMPPAWVAPLVPPGASSRQAWDRRVCSGAVTPGAAAGSCIIAGGCDQATVLLWRLAAQTGKSECPTGPCDILFSSFPEPTTVWSTAWAALPLSSRRGDEVGEDSHILAAGMDNGYVVLWDVRLPFAPVFIFAQQNTSPIWSLVWIDDLHLCVQQGEATVLDLASRKTARMRPELRKCTVPQGTACTGMFCLGSRVISTWTDGVVCVQALVGKRRRDHSSLSNFEVLATWQLSSVSSLVEKAVVETGDSEDPAKGDCGGSSAGESVRNSVGDNSTLQTCPSPTDGHWQIAKLFLARQAATITDLRPWERLALPQQSRAQHEEQNGLLLTMGAVHDKVDEVDGVRGAFEGGRSAASAAQCLRRVPLSTMDALRLAGPGDWLIACGSAAGIVHVFHHSEISPTP